MRLIREIMMLFSKILTGSVLSSAVYLEVLYKGVSMNTSKLLWQLIIESAICSLCILFMYSKKELGKYEIILRNAIIYVYVNVVVVGCAILFDWFKERDYRSIILLLIEIAVVYIAIEFLVYYRYKKIANDLNERLVEYRNRNDEEYEASEEDSSNT